MLITFAKISGYRLMYRRSKQELKTSLCDRHLVGLELNQIMKDDCSRLITLELSYFLSTKPENSTQQRHNLSKFATGKEMNRCLRIGHQATYFLVTKSLICQNEDCFDLNNSKMAQAAWRIVIIGWHILGFIHSLVQSEWMKTIQADSLFLCLIALPTIFKP